jgi:TolB-like protein/Tfp pilus assembly protein PilF
VSLFEELKRRNVLRVAAAYLVVGWLLTEVLTTLLPAFGAPEWVSKAVMLVFALGFVPAIILSWIYEFTLDGIKKESEIIHDESITRSTGRRLEFITIATVVVGILYIAIFSSRSGIDESPPAPTTIGEESVAVLPFINMSGNADNEYFSDGLTETLLHMLAQIPGLKVAARTSSFAFRDQNKTIVEIANALAVAHILEGSVQRSGDRIRITAQLIRANDGFHVWSENYDFVLDDIFAIQDEIAEKVGGALSKSLLGTIDGEAISGIATANPDAYELYLQARQARSTFSFAGLEEAEDLLKSALTIDSDFLDAKTELASNYWHQLETGLMDQESAFAEIIAITDQVIAVRPEDVDARAIRLYAAAGESVQQQDPQEFFAAVSELEEMVATDPAAFQPKIVLTRFYQSTQQFEKAVPLMKGALDRDPFNPRIYYELGSIFMALEQWDDAREALQKSLEIEPAQPNAYASLARVSLQSGDGVDYMQQFIKAIEVDPVDHELPGIIAGFLYELGLIEEGDDFRDRVMAIAPTSEIAYRIELLRAINSGDEEASIASARRAIEDDIDNRRFSYGGAVQHLLRVAASRGTVAEESAYLQEQAPNILDIEDMTTPLKYRTAQFVAFDAWYVSLPREEMLNRLDRMQEIAKSFGFDPAEDPGIRVGILALQGNVDDAVEVALADLFTESVAVNLGWRRTFSQAQFTKFVADPRIKTAMQRWEEEEAGLRARIKAYLADLFASN